MKKNKSTISRWLNAGKKIKSKRGKKLNLNKVHFPKIAEGIASNANTEMLAKEKSKKKKLKTAATLEQSLGLCSTIPEVQKTLMDGSRTLRRLALKSGKKLLSAEEFEALETLLKKKGATSDPILIDPGILLSAFQQLAQSFAALGNLDDKIEFAFVTIIDGRFETSDHNTELDLCELKASARRILSKMSPNYFAVAELALFNSHTHHSGGRLVSLHVHAIIWGVGVQAEARAIANHFQLSVDPNTTGAKPIVVKSVDPDTVNLARMAAYLLKEPHKCKTFYPGSESKPGNTHHSRKSDRLVRYLRLAEIRSMLTFKDVTFASGEGLALRSGIAKSLSLLAQEQARKAPRRFHPAEIPSFWGKLKVSMRTTRFNLPIIKRTK
jgi:hypothetical protein